MQNLPSHPAEHQPARDLSMAERERLLLSWRRHHPEHPSGRPRPRHRGGRQLMRWCPELPSLRRPKRPPRLLARRTTEMV